MGKLFENVVVGALLAIAAYALYKLFILGG